MALYQLIGEKELTTLAAAIKRNGWKESDFELQEDVFDPATAEVEAALGEVGIKCLKTQAVAVYRIGPGLDWVSDFIEDLRLGKFGRPSGPA